MLQIQNLAGHRLAQRQNRTASEVGEIHLLRNLLAQLIVLVNLTGLTERNLSIRILHLTVGHHRAVAVNLKVTLVRVHNHVEILVRAECLLQHTAERVLKHTHQRRAVNVLGLLKVLEGVNKVHLFNVFLCHLCS